MCKIVIRGQWKNGYTDGAKTALMKAFKSGHESNVGYLTSRGGDVNEVSTNSKSKTIISGL